MAEHEHRWAPIGLYNADGTLSCPCLEGDCGAEVVIDQIGGRRYLESGFDTLGFDIDDDPNGGVSKIICREVELFYSGPDLDLREGEVVVDVGAHVGIVSIYLADEFPGIRAIALEPVPANYARLVRNLVMNEVQGVVPLNLAMTSDGRDVVLRGNLAQNSGGASIYAQSAFVAMARSITFERLLETFEIERVALLKIDCEGAEHEILTSDVLAKVDRIRGEFHRVGEHDPRALLERVKRVVPDTWVEVCG